jgi:hypothetical protein
MARRHDAAADDDGPPLAEPAIREHAAENRREIRHRRIDAVNERRPALPNQKLLGHVIDQQGAHPEVGELFPHFGQKKDGESSRLTEPRLLVGAHRGRKGVARRIVVAQRFPSDVVFELV